MPGAQKQSKEADTPVSFVLAVVTTDDDGFGIDVCIPVSPPTCFFKNHVFMFFSSNLFINIPFQVDAT